MLRVLQRCSNCGKLKLKLGGMERERERGDHGLAWEGPLMLTNDNTTQKGNVLYFFIVIITWIKKFLIFKSFKYIKFELMSF